MSTTIFLDVDPMHLVASGIEDGKEMELESRKILIYGHE